MANGNLTVNRMGPEAFKDNETGYHDSYVVPARDYKPPMLKAVDFRVYAVIALAAIIGFLVFFAVYSLWKWVYCMAPERYYTCQTLATAEPIAFGVILALPLVLATVHVAMRIRVYARYQLALSNKANLVLNRYGDNEPADLYNRISPQEIIAFLTERYMTATGLERANAPYKEYRGVNSLSLHNTHNAGDNLLGDDGETLLEALTPDQWLPATNGVHHIMIAGSTGEGKTVTAKAILLPRLQAGEHLFVIDPHSSYWYGIAGRAGGEDWEDCKLAIAEIFTEYKARVQERHQYLLVTGSEMPEDHFTRLNILVDEAFLIQSVLDTGTSKKVINYWSLLAEILSSGARKVGISLILLTQTANVEDLGISGPLRRNFFRIAVDAMAIRTMIAKDETDTDRKRQLYEALVGMAYPATAEIGGQIHLLDRRGLLPMAQTPVDVHKALWVPPAGRSFVLGGPNANENGTSRTNEPTNGSTINRLVELRRKKITRDQARREYGLSFTDDDFRLAGEILGDDV